MKTLFIIAAVIIIGIILLFVYAIFKVSAEADKRAAIQNETGYCYRCANYEYNPDACVVCTMVNDNGQSNNFVEKN